MLDFIIKEPQADETDQDRGHSIPFHSDMVFSFGKAHINGKFFRSEAQDRLLASQALGSVDQKASNPSQMIDVFMTPQSDDTDDDFSDGGGIFTTTSPPSQTNTEDNDEVQTKDENDDSDEETNAI